MPRQVGGRVGEAPRSRRRRSGLYRAAVLGRPRLRGTLCVKVSLRPEAWHREAYFGQLLAECPRAIAIHDSFATFVKRAGTTTPLYCLVSILAARGDLEDYLSHGRKQWSEAKMCLRSRTCSEC